MLIDKEKRSGKEAVEIAVQGYDQAGAQRASETRSYKERGSGIK